MLLLDIPTHTVEIPTTDTGTFRNSDIPSFEIQTGDLDKPPYRALPLGQGLAVAGLDTSTGNPHLR